MYNVHTQERKALQKALATTKRSILPSSLCSSGSFLAEAHWWVLSTTWLAVEDSSSSASCTISSWSMSVLEVERARSESAGPRRGQSRGLPGSRSPAPKPAALSRSFVQIGSWQNWGWGPQRWPSLKHVSNTFNSDVYFINKHNPLPFGRQNNFALPKMKSRHLFQRCVWSTAVFCRAHKLDLYEGQGECAL